MSYFARRFVPAATRQVAVRSISTRSVACDFGWQKLVTPLTHPSFIARMKEYDNKFATMRAEMFGVPDKIEPIDWDSWEKQITNKALFQQIKKEYESIVYPEIKGDDLTAVNKQLDYNIMRATQAAEISKAEIAKHEKELEQAKHDKKAIHTWGLQDWFNRFPGLEEQFREEYMNGEYLASDAEERAFETDFVEARNIIKKGGQIDIPEGLPERWGNYVYAEERKRVEDMLERMFSGSKIYEEFKAKEAAAEAKKKEEEHHH